MALEVRPVGLQRRRFVSRGRAADARIEHRRNRSHHPLAQRIDHGPRSREGPTDRCHRAEQLPAASVDHLGLEFDLLAAAVVGTGDDRAGPRRLGQRPDVTRTRESGLAQIRTRRQAGRARHHIDHLDLIEPLGDPIRRHAAQRVEVRVARLIVEDRHDDTPLVQARPSGFSGAERPDDAEADDQGGAGDQTETERPGIHQARWRAAGDAGVDLRGRDHG